MSLINLLQSKKLDYSFDEIQSVLDLSPGYSRKVISKYVNNKILTTANKKSDKRKVIYTLNWAGLRQYLLSNPPEYEDLVFQLAGKAYDGMYVALDNFTVLEFDHDLLTLHQKVGHLASNSTVLITSVGDLQNPIILEN